MFNGTRLLCWVATFWLLAVASTAAQDRRIPDDSYYISVERLYSGDLRGAERDFTREFRGAVRTASTRWIDSVLYSAMLGESLYLQGRYQEALVEFNGAAQLFVTYSTFMKRAQFPALSTEVGRVRLSPPWGPANRRATFARVQQNQLIQFGRVNNQRQVETGGVVQVAQLWRIDISEVMRTMVLAIRRRTELLGPLAEYDPLSRSLESVTSRGDLAPTGSWGNNWGSLVAGWAKLGINKPKEALPLLRQAASLEGRYTHPLTGLALLGQAEALFATGKLKQAAGMFYEASLAAFAYEDFETIDSALWRGHITQIALQGKGPYPPLERAVAWADRENLDLFQIRYRLAIAESLLATGKTQQAQQLLRNRTRARSRDLNTSPLATRNQFLTAQALYQAGDTTEAGQTLARAFEQQANYSLLRFQTRLANTRFDTRELSARLAVQVYTRLLSDPTPADWLRDPHDTLTHLKTNYEPALARWLAAHLGRREFDKAIEAADIAKRRRFFAAQPLGGRQIALQQLLEGRPGAAPPNKDVLAERQIWLAETPEYGKLIQAAAEQRKALQAAKTIIAGDRLAREVNHAVTQLAKISQQREQLLRSMALTRRGTRLELPPTKPLDKIQESLRPGDAIVAFHQAADSMNGFLITNDGSHYWRLPGPDKLEGQVSKLLRSMGARSHRAKIEAKQAISDEWREASAELASLLLKDSRLDVTKVKRLVIVPDGVLWHVPFDALVAPGSGEQTLTEIAPVRYTPTLGFALPSKDVMLPVRRTALAAPKPQATDRDGEAEFTQQRLADAAKFGDKAAERLQPPVGAPAAEVASLFDLMLVTLESEIDRASPYAWQPAPLTRSGGMLADWIRLAGEAPQRLVLGEVHTAAENALKSGRRERSTATPPPAGTEMFHATCGLLVSGVRTALISRWTTQGLTHQNLLREFAAEVPHVAAPEAWRRSVSLARETLLDPAQEPRLDTNIEDEPPRADHPFFWGGYLLIDTSFDVSNGPAEVPAEVPAEAPVAAEPQQAAAAN